MVTRLAAAGLGVVLAAAVIGLGIVVTGPATAAEEKKPPSIFPAKWSMWAYRWAPWWPVASYDHQVVPFIPRPTARPSTDQIPVPVGVVVRTSVGGSTLLHRSIGPEGARLDVESHAEAGAYQGTVEIVLDSPVELTVNVADRPLVPGLALVGGLVLAWFIQRQRGVWSRLVALREEVRSAETEFFAALESCKESPTGEEAIDQQPRIFTQADVDALRAKWRQRVEQMLSAIDVLAARYPLALDPKDEDLAGLTKNIALLRGLRATIFELADAKIALSQALAQAEKDAPARRAWGEDYADVGGPGPWPRFIEVLRERYNASLVRDLDTLGELVAEIKTNTTLAVVWKDLADELIRRERLFSRLGEHREHMPLMERRLMESIRGLLSEIRWDLWNVEDAKDLKRRSDERERVQLESDIAKLAYHLREPAPPAAREVGIQLYAATLTLQPLVDKFRAVVRPQTPEEARVARWEWWTFEGRMTGGIAYGLALVLLLYAGFAALYLGKPFGTLTDYMAAVAWGSGAKIGLDVAATALGGISLPRLPRRTTP